MSTFLATAARAAHLPPDKVQEATPPAGRLDVPPYADRLTVFGYLGSRRCGLAPPSRTMRRKDISGAIDVKMRSRITARTGCQSFAPIESIVSIFSFVRFRESRRTDGAQEPGAP